MTILNFKVMDHCLNLFDYVVAVDCSVGTYVRHYG
jgi:tRNA U55 pseudouridine synthase TruB